MQKKGIIAILCAVALTIVASISLVLALGPRVSANSGDNEEPSIGILDKAKYFNIDDNNVLSGLTDEGCEYANQFDELDVIVPSYVKEISGYMGCYAGVGRYTVTLGAFDWWVNPEYMTQYDFTTDKVRSIVLPDSLEVISGPAFSGANLSSIVIPRNVIFVAELGYRSKECAFYACNNLTTIYCECSEEYANEHWDADWKKGCSAEVVWNYVPTYTVTFNVDGIDAQTVNKNEHAVAPTNPTSESYNFQYWYADDENVAFDFANTPITQDITLNAKWEIKHFTVTFDACGGVASVNSQNVDYGNKITTVPTTEYAEHDFQGWFEDLQDTTAFDFNSEITENKTLFAKWNLTNYIVAFNVNGGTAVAAQEVPSGQKAEPKTTTKTGYTFAGWYTDANLTHTFDFDTAITSSRTIYAQWTIDQYTVVFNSNEGSVVVAQVVNYNEKATQPEDPTREGYTFQGWYSEAALVNAYDFNTSVTDDVTLYAKWESVPDSGVNVAAIAGGVAGGVAGVGTLSTILMVVIRRRRKLL